MRIFVLLMISLCLSVASISQTKAETFSKIEKLLNKAKGQTIAHNISKIKLGKQTFTESMISLTDEGLGKYSSTWISDYTNLDWSASSYYTSSTDLKFIGDGQNTKVRLLTIIFEKPVTYEHYVKGESDDDKSTTKEIQLYFMAKDNEAVEKLLKAITRPL